MVIADVSNKSLSELTALTNKVAVVTGGTKGIGLAIAKRLAEAGATVLAAGRDQATADAAAASVTQGKVIGAQVDASDPTSLRQLSVRAVNELGRLDIWVNNAGIFPFKPSLDVTNADWHQVIDLNLSGVFFGSREAARQMAERNTGGVIVNISSIGGLRGGAGMAAYSAAKHGVEGLTKSLAIEFGAMGIRVLSIAPTIIQTPGVEERMSTPGQETAPGEEQVQRIPLGRVGVPDDVARAVLFCASDLSLFLTGSTLYLDGGQLALV